MKILSVDPAGQIRGRNLDVMGDTMIGITVGQFDEETLTRFAFLPTRWKGIALAEIARRAAM